MSEIVPSKPCSKCGAVKPIEAGFYRSKLFKSGFAAQCKECTKAQTAKWAAENPERKKQHDRSKYERYLANRPPVPCACGCGLMTKGKSKGEPFYPGHANRGKPAEHMKREPGFPAGVLVDDDVRERLGVYRWSINGDGYVQRHVVVEPGRYSKVMLHREVMNFPKYLLIDHINGNRLDNRRANLRFVDDKSNAQNQVRANKSGHRGVSWRENMCKWYAHAKIDGRMISLGFYDELEEAAKVAKDFRQKNYKGFIDR